ncbi:MAG: 50S ribosomal protein L3 [bacterium]
MNKTLFGKKIGMTQIFSEAGEMIAVQIVQCTPMTVLKKKTSDKDGYEALVVGVGKTSRKKNKPVTGQFRGFGSFTAIREIPVFSGELTPGSTIDISLFEDVKMVDVQGVSKGKGFAGNVKRHHFNRGPMTHGHDHHRAPGSIGAGTTPGRVYKNTRMAGRLGNKNVSVLGQKLVKVDKENNLLFIQGSVPGAKNSPVRITVSSRA